MDLFNKFKKSNKSTAPSAETWQVTVHGTVQGVGFRWSVQTLAQGLSIPGTVKNNPDGTVTICLQAPRLKVDEFLKELPHNLSPFAKIQNIKLKKLENVAKMHDFHVLY